MKKALIYKINFSCAVFYTSKATHFYCIDGVFLVKAKLINLDSIMNVLRTITRKLYRL